MPFGLEPGWLWAIGGILLLMLEMLAPGFFLVFIGAAAIATGAFTLLFGLGVPAQLALFALYALLAVAAGRRIYGNAAVDHHAKHLNDPAARLIGRSVLVIEAVDDHGGRVRLGDGEWSARGGPAQPGDRARITGVDGNCLRIDVERTLPST
ncbi:NfeD family protein [Sphingomonas piscis]|uniref:NfeD family protein n=1 Tax=Sphingomonas piscis TaxID=2714943 RepID=A0A6G7YST9_9SPHN|nr:NfeD family protein [Sphingomonas piscis]QIK79791.1 NfeD family protein [Sphingomonas piscis]